MRSTSKQIHQDQEHESESCQIPRITPHAPPYVTLLITLPHVTLLPTHVTLLPTPPAYYITPHAPRVLHYSPRPPACYITPPAPRILHYSPRPPHITLLPTPPAYYITPHAPRMLHYSSRTTTLHKLSKFLMPTQATLTLPHHPQSHCQSHFTVRDANEVLSDLFKCENIEQYKLSLEYAISTPCISLLRV